MEYPLPRSPANYFSLLFLLVSFASSKPQNFLNKGSSASVGDDLDLLTSQDKSFTCGFYQVGTNAYCFSIWFTNSANRTVVWMANRDRPVNGRGSRISLQRDGIMVLTDRDRSIVWSTKTVDTGVDKAELLNTGNLVLKDSSGNILWQSFDSPTDTLLPSQPLSKNNKLISAMRKGTYSSGYFSFYFDTNNVLMLMYDGPEISSIYWPNPEFSLFQNGRKNYNSSRIAILDDMGRFLSSDQTWFYASDMGLGIRRRLTMDYDGNLRLYSLDESTRLWDVSWEALPQQCSVHGLCGRNSICVYTPKPKCSCPPAYEMNDPSDWSKGCKAKFNQNCSQPPQVKFVGLPQTMFYGFDLDFQLLVSFDQCMKLCAENCSCLGFNYRITGEGYCFTKTALFNGYKSPNVRETTYLKLPQSVETSGSKGSDLICRSTGDELLSESGHTKLITIYLFIAVIAAIEVLFIASGWLFLSRRHGVAISVDDGYGAIFNQFRKFTFAELNKATKNFQKELGSGGSGSVYKGVLGDNRVVAVKKLGDVIQGEEEFWAEVSVIGRINHMNLVRMWGFCSEKAHRLLVSEYVENGSLDKHLFSNSSSSSRVSLLKWKQRFRIALGAAKGLAYLHHECLEWVIHCDVKPENILLDTDFEPKIADFGLAKLSQRGKPGSEFSRIRGTKGYMGPEWVLNLPITSKIDVYSYGVVLLEIIMGIRVSSLAVVVDGKEEEVAALRRFLRAVKEDMENGEDLKIEDIVDPRLEGQFNRRQAAKMVKIGISCVEEDRSKRPTMDAVVQALLECENESELRSADMV